MYPVRIFMSLLLIAAACQPCSGKTLRSVLRETQKKVVKIYGAGGLRQMEAYQSGILISAEGHVLTVLSYVLDTDDLAVVLDDGQLFEAELLASDPVLELALLKLPAESSVPHFDLDKHTKAAVGDRVLALSNLYGIAAGNEPVSVLHGVVTAVAPLQARRGRFQSNFAGPVYMVDAQANNPGAAGGALVDWQGQLLGMLGKELRSEVTGGWLHYALPVEAFHTTTQDMQAGRKLDNTRLQLAEPESPLSAALLGVTLIPEVLPRTPPYIDSVIAGTPAHRAGLRPDDLIVFVGLEPTASCASVNKMLSNLEATETVALSVLRDGQLIELELASERPAEQLAPEEPRSTLKILKPEITESEPADSSEAESEP
ncbi:S1C family serine protease [Adhaeretor mobilis]|uniref:Serine endoprotease DegS n=1 Tax=Adhaeretor mobilis TaxID=1930276 RepID=A0A517MX17_9BACT|nr:S1C family serine protease [Adhaeretor mobilis]QDS99424.1 Serine endoprotease DegS [Adhaeretor mobilis]